MNRGRIDTASGAYKPSTKETKKNDTPLSDRVLNLLHEIETKGYKWVEPEELGILRNNADDYTSEIMELAGYILGYDQEEMLVWVEETPIEMDKLNQLPMEVVND